MHTRTKASLYHLLLEQKATGKCCLATSFVETFTQSLVYFTTRSISVCEINRLAACSAVNDLSLTHTRTRAPHTRTTGRDSHVFKCPMRGGTAGRQQRQLCHESNQRQPVPVGCFLSFPPAVSSPILPVVEQAFAACQPVA